MCAVVVVVGGGSKVGRGGSAANGQGAVVWCSPIHWCCDVMCCAGVAQCWEVEQACDCERACACPVLSCPCAGCGSVSELATRARQALLSLSLSLLSPSSSPLSLDSLLFSSLTLSNSLSASLSFSLSYYYLYKLSHSRTLVPSPSANQSEAVRASQPVRMPKSPKKSRCIQSSPQKRCIDHAISHSFHAANQCMHAPYTR